MTKVLIIGGGFAGCCAAHVLENKNWQIDLIESSNILGGGVLTHWYGGHPYTFGPRHFLTEKSEWFEFLNEFVPMRIIGNDHENLTYVEPDKAFYSYPPHMDDIEKMDEKEQIMTELENFTPPTNEEEFNFEDIWKTSITPTLYKKFAEKYSKKMWMIDDNKELDGEEFRPVKVAHDGEVIGTCKVKIRKNSKAVWSDSRVISAFPFANNGYNDYFDIAVKNANVHLNTKAEVFDIDKKRVKIKNDWKEYDILINTASPEYLLNGIYGELRWMGRDFMKIVFPVESIFPKNVYFQYYANDENFTRIVEYKKFYRYNSSQTLLGIEIPSKNNKLYPYPTKKDQQHAQKYFDDLPDSVFNMGRAGTYRYIDMDDIVGQGLELRKNI